VAEKAKPRTANSPATKFIERIENLNKQLDEIKSEHMLKCKDVRADIKQVLDEAKAEGYTKAVIKAVVKARALERKAGEAREDLDIADRDTFDVIRHALGDYADTPLGAAALDAARNGSAEAHA